jgi:DNA invertase Pin-like site-specific DNA recombinase
VSTAEQADHGAGLDVQRDAITELAAEQSITITAWYSDEGESGSNGLDSRYGLADALDALDTGAEVVVIYRLDRLARDLVLQEQLLADAWRRGGRVVSCSHAEDAYLDPDDKSDPSRTLIRQVLGAVAQYERAMIVARMQAGRRRKIRDTGYAGGPRPYGWQPDGRGGVVPDIAEQAVLRHVADLRAAGQSWQQCVNDLNARGVSKQHGHGTWKVNELHRMMQRATGRWGGPIPDAFRAELPPRQDMLSLS